MKSRIDVIIPTRNRGALVTRTLRSLQGSSVQDFQVWIVDQSENTETAVAVAPFLAKDGRFTLVRSATKGANVARNVGLTASSAPIIVFTDDDCRVSEDWLENYLQEYETYPAVASIFGRIVPGEMPVDPQLDAQLNRVDAQHLQKILPMAKKEEDERQLFEGNRFNLGFGHGANMSFRRSTFNLYGVFDEFLGSGNVLGSWEERDIGYRILSKGGQILYAPGAVVFHDHWREWSAIKKSIKDYAIGTGAAVSKYMRMGDWRSSYLLFDWMVQQGLRQIASGVFRWHSRRKTQAGFVQLFYPWVGLTRGLNYAIDKQNCVYTGKKGQVPNMPISEKPSSTNQL
jgi:glycosyltransferase involved in cell wall biosynthesis